MRLEHAVEGLPVEWVVGAGDEIEVAGLAYDSRQVEPGDLFVAWQGERFDGRQYAPQAIERGAVAVLASSGGSPDGGVPWLESQDPRALMAPIAARLFGHPDRELQIVGVTGTNGKTTVSFLVQAILERAGRPTGIFGTLGYRFGQNEYPGERTTPEGADFYRYLRHMVDAGAQAVAMEVSSHALEQGRVDDTAFAVAVFTNLTRDHLDFHGDMESYFRAKKRLFDLLGSEGTAVLNLDDAKGGELAAQLSRVLTFASESDEAADVWVLERQLDARGTHLRLMTPRGPLDVRTNLRGSYNVSNTCAAVAVAEALELDREAIVDALAAFQPVDGRLDPIDEGQSFPVFLDYAHTDGGLDAALRSTRSLAAGEVVLVFGCGGDRDQGKRPLMGRVAGELADLPILTDDNPRREDPAQIREAVIAGLEEAGNARYRVIGDRRTAIRAALQHAHDEGDCVVLVAGKGHESGQIVGDEVRPFSDAEEIRSALAELAEGRAVYEDAPSTKGARWPMTEAATAMGGELVDVGRPEGLSFEGIAFDSRRVREGQLFFALAGEQTDGHRFVDAALAAGAAAAVVEAGRPNLPEGPLVAVDDTFAALHDLTRWVRERTPQHLVGITGSAGKTTTKQLLAAMLRQAFEVAESPGNLNNLYGFPMSLLGIPKSTEWMVAEMGMSTPGELGGVSELGRPDVAVFTNVRLVHLEAFDRDDHVAGLRDIADAKSELLRGLVPGGLIVANADDAEVTRLAERYVAEDTTGCRIAWYSLAGDAASRPTRLKLVSAIESSSRGIAFEVDDEGRRVPVRLPLHGAVNAGNFFAAATCALELGVDLDRLVEAVRTVDLGAGRGRRLRLAGGIEIIDDTYNSNPDALEHAVDALLEIEAERRWLVAGEMRELGRSSSELHRECGEQIAAREGIDQVVAVGEEARPMAVALEAAGRAVRWVADADGAAEILLAELVAGDLALIKGSRGVGLELAVERLLSERGEEGSD